MDYLTLVLKARDAKRMGDREGYHRLLRELRGQIDVELAEPGTREHAREGTQDAPGCEDRGWDTHPLSHTRESNPSVNN